jgi:hypothetical protein
MPATIAPSVGTSSARLSPIGSGERRDDCRGSHQMVRHVSEEILRRGKAPLEVLCGRSAARPAPADEEDRGDRRLTFEGRADGAPGMSLVMGVGPDKDDGSVDAPVCGRVGESGERHVDGKVVTPIDCRRNLAVDSGPQVPWATHGDGGGLKTCWRR